MPKCRNGPLSDAVTLRAVLAKVSPMRIFCAVAAYAIEHSRLLAKPRMGCGQRSCHGYGFAGAWVNPIGERGRHTRIQRAHTGGTKIPMTDSREPGVIHHRGHPQTALVLHMATAANLNVAVKRRGRTLQQRSLIRVTGNAFVGIYTDDGRMARPALIGQKEVALRQRPGPHCMLNGKSHPVIARKRHGGGKEEDHEEHSPYHARLHRSHRRPK